MILKGIEAVVNKTTAFFIPKKLLKTFLKQWWER